MTLSRLADERQQAEQAHHALMEALLGLELARLHPTDRSAIGVRREIIAQGADAAAVLMKNLELLEAELEANQGQERQS